MLYKMPGKSRSKDNLPSSVNTLPKNVAGLRRLPLPGTLFKDGTAKKVRRGRPRNVTGLRRIPLHRLPLPGTLFKDGTAKKVHRSRPGNVTGLGRLPSRRLPVKLALPGITSKGGTAKKVRGGRPKGLQGRMVFRENIRSRGGTSLEGPRVLPVNRRPGGRTPSKGQERYLRRRRLKHHLRNQKPKWRYLRYSLLNAKSFWGKRKKFLGLKSFFKSKEDFRVKPLYSCTRKTYKGGLTEVRKIRLFFGFTRIQVLKNFVVKYPKIRRSRLKLLVNCLECRLSVVVFRMGFSSSALMGAKYVKEGRVFVDGFLVFKPGYILAPGSRVSLKRRLCRRKVKGKKILDFFANISKIQNKIPPYLEMNYKKMTGIFLRQPLGKQLMYPENFCFKTALRRLEK